MEKEKLLFHVIDSSYEFSIEAGTKSGMLSKVSSIVRVPRFWTISEEYFLQFLVKCGINSTSVFFENQYCTDYVRMLNDCNCNIELDYSYLPDKKYIVRSSIVPYEHTADFASMISGAFESIVCDGNHIIETILQVYSSVFSEKAHNQIRLFSLEKNIKGMSIIIQEYISADYSGVIHVTDNKGMQLQWLKGHLSDIVDGSNFGHSNYIYYDSNQDAVFRGSEKEIIYLKEHQIANIFSDALSIAVKIYNFNKEPQEIEWIFDGKEHWIVQCQKLIE